MAPDASVGERAEARIGPAFDEDWPGSEALVFHFCRVECRGQTPEQFIEIVQQRQPNEPVDGS